MSVVLIVAAKNVGPVQARKYLKEQMFDLLADFCSLGNPITNYIKIFHCDNRTKLSVNFS